jgi:predicted ATPase
MIQRITGGKRLPAEVVRQMVVKTDGVPLFVVGTGGAGTARGRHSPDASGSGRQTGHGVRDWTVDVSSQLAEAYGGIGQAEAGLHLLAESLAWVDTTGERHFEAEVYRIKGELLLGQAIPDTPQAEACFQQALAVARRQQAKSWELRTAMSLSRLWQRQDKRAEAHELLAPIYGWFTEGFDTADLQEAKALLEELA